MTVNDGGAGNARLATLATSHRANRTLSSDKVAEVEPGKNGPPPRRSALIPFAAKTLAAQKAAPGPIKTLKPLVREQEEKAKTTHDPNLSKFEGK